MAQHDYDIANAAGANVRADINNVLAAIATNNSGAAAPSTTFAHQWWFDTTTSLLKQRNAANTAWVTVAAKDGSGWRTYHNGTELAIIGQAEAEAGTATTARLWTAERVAQAIAALQSALSGMADGTELLPGWPFTSDPDTGFYKQATNVIGVTCGGDEQARFGVGSAGISVKAGAPGAPGYSFFVDEDTGVYRVGVNSMGMVTGGIERMRINASGLGTGPALQESLIIAAGDEVTAITAGTGKVAFRMPYAFTVTGVRASLKTAQSSGSLLTVDVNESGTTILSTKITLDNNERTSQTALTPPVISDSALADDAEITLDVDQIGDGTAVGLKVALIGYKPLA